MFMIKRKKPILKATNYMIPIYNILENIKPCMKTVKISGCQGLGKGRINMWSTGAFRAVKLFCMRLIMDAFVKGPECIVQ